MPRKRKVPSYTRHKASGQAVVRIDGKDFYLGKYGSPESHQEYRRLVNDMVKAEQGGCKDPTIFATVRQSDLTLNELILRYLTHADAHYRKRDGTPTSEIGCLQIALKPLREAYGFTPAVEIGPKALRDVRDRMIAAGWCRLYINRHVGRIIRMFRWAASQEYLPATVAASLKTVAGLSPGRTTANETEPVLPVAQDRVEAVLPHLTAPAS